MSESLRYLSLFSGMGAGDVGLDRAGMECAGQVENDRHALLVLERHWPGMKRVLNVQDVRGDEFGHIDLIIGGDPCPFRSKARSIWGSNSPDLWPEFRRIVSVVRPLWVLRENVPADDVDDCWADLCRLGYDAIVIEADSAAVTGQSRPREYLCGVLGTARVCLQQVFHERQSSRRDTAAVQKAAPLAHCLTTNPWRFDSRDNYVLEPGRGTRILAPIERERLQSVEPGWTDCVSDAQRAKLTGNAMTAELVRWFGERIMLAEVARREYAAVDVFGTFKP